MKKIYQKPFIEELYTVASYSLLVNSNGITNDNKINVNTSTMEVGDGSDAVKDNGDWNIQWE